MQYIIAALFHIGIYAVYCQEISDSEPTEDGLYGPAVAALDYIHFPVRKCHCGANEYWNQTNQLCLPQLTAIEFLTNFHPEQIESIPTTDFSDLFISDVTCEDSVPLQVTKVAFNAPNTVFHRESGDSFQRYCIEHIQNEAGDVIISATVCIPSLTIPACCPEGHSLNPVSLVCERDQNISFSPPIHFGPSPLREARFIQYLQEIPRCHLPSIQRKPLQSRSDGVRSSLHYQQSHIMFFEWAQVENNVMPATVKLPIDFCVAMEQTAAGTEYSAYIWDEWAFEMCRNSTLSRSTRPTDQCEQTMYWVLLPLLVLSSVCLVVILVLHAVLGELRKSIGSKITICHVASLLAGFVVLLILHAPLEFNCKIFGPIVQVCFLATFFWLNVMCFDIWWKLRRTSPARDTTQGSKQKFLKYSVYAWGSPLIIGLVTVLMDNIPELQNNPNLILPGFGTQNCWFADRSATFAYYFGVIAVLMVLNLFFFMSVFVILLKANCIYNQVLRDDIKSSRRSWIYFKIFGVMGLTWICEFFSWQEGTCKYWIVTDIINSLRGLILFVIFFGNKNSFDKIRVKFTSINARLQDHVSQSMNNLRKMSLKPNSTVESGLDSYKSEALSEINHKAEDHEQESNGKNEPQGTV